MIFIKGAGSGALRTPGVTAEVPELDEICSGTAYLRVPLLGDVIQVGVGGTMTMGMIEVRKIRTAMTVRRTDGKPMQVQILHEQRGQLGSSVRTEVFAKPVECLNLQRTEQPGARRWLAGGGAVINRQQDLQQFVNTIATFNLAKQRRG
jgi:hypothetical protein